MNQLLISVKNVEEALIARYADVDLIDLKNPNVGALGALDLDVVHEVVTTVNHDALISATVGEGHESVDALVKDVGLYASMGVHIVKTAVSDLYQESNFFDEMLKLSKKDIKLVAVFFADETLDLNMVEALAEAGFYGAMLDTKQKKSSLMEVRSISEIKAFLRLCEQHGLVSGLAGSLNANHIQPLNQLAPTFIGMRGGVCAENNRTSTLLKGKVEAAKALLLNYNSSLL